MEIEIVPDILLPSCTTAGCTTDPTAISWILTKLNFMKLQLLSFIYDASLPAPLSRLG